MEGRVYHRLCPPALRTAVPSQLPVEFRGNLSMKGRIVARQRVGAIDSLRGNMIKS
jgi:hypothetical protein